mgnify:CR=1 FL=1
MVIEKGNKYGRKKIYKEMQRICKKLLQRQSGINRQEWKNHNRRCICRMVLQSITEFESITQHQRARRYVLRDHI